MELRRCYISKAYPDKSTGGNKAKTDVEDIMSELGFTNLGLKQSLVQNPIWRFLYTLTSIIKACFSIKKNDLIVIQYPFKKYYVFLCKIANLKGAKTISLIHDLGSFRRKKLNAKQEKKRLAHSHYLISLNCYMKEFLVNSGYTQAIGSLEMWDYLSPSTPKASNKNKSIPEVIYAGSLPHKKHSFLYELNKVRPPKSYTYSIYGSYCDTKSIDNKQVYDYKGFVDSDELIRETTGDYGLVWYGHSISEIDGAYGEYLQITSAHKPSLYIRCNIPIIAWSKSAQAKFIKENNLGICIDSLDQLDAILSEISPEEYKEMKQNTIEMSKKMQTGHFFKTAYFEAEKEILKQVSTKLPKR